MQKSSSTVFPIEDMSENKSDALADSTSGNAQGTPARVDRLAAIYSATRKNEKVVLEWKDIQYSTFVKDPVKSSLGSTVYKKKEILRGISGRAESGQLLACMGPTGCGKTSLMNVLAARVPTGGSAMQRLSGSVSVNGKPRNDSAFRKISAYVLQDDYMYAHLTVQETLVLAAHFFLPTELPDEEKLKIVDTVIMELGLSKARDTIIGNDKVRGVSGGERKRANVATQLICDPAVLFLDEPTSGLDSFQALSVMESMKGLANNGRLVISVIHQPRSSIYFMFDQLILLSNGRTMYFGTASDAVNHFSRLGHVCPESFNPADFFLDLLSPDNRTIDLERETGARIETLGDAWADCEKLTDVEKGASATAGVSEEEFGKVRSVGTSMDAKKVVRNLGLLCWRAWAEQSRDIPTIAVKCVITVVFSLILGGIYSNIGDSQDSIQNRTGLLFFVTINQAFTGLIAVLNTFPKEKTIVNRERAGRAYDTISYFFAKVFVEIPLNVLPSLIYSCILYYMVGLNPKTFGQFILICMFEVLCAISLGLAVSAAVPTVEAANAIGPPFMIIGILFGGFYIDINSLPIVANCKLSVDCIVTLIHPLF